MKNLYTLLAFILLAGMTAFGQGKVDYDSRSRFYLGFNLGGTYHSNTEVDVNNLYRGGAGFTFGYSFGMKPGNLLSLDLQARYLLAAYRGISDSKYTLNTNTNDILNLNEPPLQPVLDYENAYGYYVPSFHSWVNDWSLELKLNTNRLRENTGWNFFVLGGIGTTRYNTRVDFYDATSAGQVKLEDDLFNKKQSLLDYETPIINNRDWMPSFGAGIERQITPNAAFTLMGRMTWTRNNDFDGLANSFSGQPSESNDRYHYASAGIKFYLRGHKNAYVDDDEDPIVNPNPQVPVSGQKPVARFTNPNTTPISVTNNQYNLLALVQNVAGKQNIVLKQNNRTVSNYVYNANTDKLTYKAFLNTGQNTFVVTATNDYGKAQDQTVIIYNPVVNIQAPVVTITNPSANNLAVSNSSFNFEASVLYVDGKSNIEMYINGNANAKFNYNTNSKKVTSSLSLVPGKNVITLTGTNRDGSDSKTTTIIYREVISKQPPVVSISSPSSGLTVTSPQVNVLGRVLYVSQKSNITVKVNGQIFNNFNFNNSNSGVSFKANLALGNNTIQIIGTNSDGSDQANVVIVYQPNQTVQPPVVSIYSPSNGAVVNVPNTTVKGKAIYVANKGNITVLVNGQSTNNFSFNSSSKNVTVNTGLKNGNNIIQIIGNNSDGQDQATINVVYKKPVVKTPPVVSIIDPSSNNKVYTVGSITAKSKVLFVNNSNDINVTLNGNNIYNFSFNANSKLLTIPLNLVSGKNTLVVTGTNNDGTDTKQRIINYKKAVTVSSPTVKFSNPGYSPYTVSNSVFNVKAITTNITSKSQIIFKQNGNVVSNNAFNFVGSTLTYPATLVLGNNVFEVTVTNSGGSDNKTTVIKYEKEVIPCTKPTIGYVAPSPNSTVSVANQNIEAQINNYIPGTKVTLKLNGANQGTMSFNQSTQIANKNVVLKQGSNTLEVTVTNSCGTNKSTFVINYNSTTPCKKPVLAITSSSQTISTASYLLKANVSNITNVSQVVLKLNGVIKNVSLNSGVLTANLKLKNGVNIITIVATNSCGNDTKSITITSNQCKPPKLQLVAPLKTAVSIQNSNYSIKLRATGDVSKANIVVKQNNKSVPFSYSTTSKLVTINASGLKNGLNTISVAVNNSCGSENILYKVTASLCTKPTVNMSGADSGPRGITVKSHSYKFSGNVSGMTSKTGISLLLNGKGVPFSYNSSTGQVTSNITLKEGSNSLVLSAKNACGSSSKTLSITAKTCTPPVLKNKSTKGSIVTQNSSQKFSYSVTGITNANQIVVKLNGKIISKSFSKNTLVFTATGLKIGLNTVVVSATNNCGSDKSTIKVTRKTCTKPLVTQKTNSNQVTSLAFSYSAVVSGVAAKSNIVLKLNNKSVSFNYNASTKLVTASLTLKEGVNSIVLSATNSCGVTNKSHTVTAKTCKVPQIKVGYPTNTSITTANSTFSLLAVGINVVQSNITVKNNGSSIPFSFNASNGKITIQVANMSSGTNKIVIKGANACGTSQITYSINYTGSNRSGKSSNGNGESAPPKRN
ncbi:MAG: hypothetical protein AB8B74_07170 [Crocinitomicaceae bacterium]